MVRNNKRTIMLATFGGGCFWCTEAIFKRLAGVKSVVSVYAGGEMDNPTYKAVCEGVTGHAEVIQVEYDPKTIGYNELLKVFFLTHDPTTLNRQGNDVGTQYRSIILYHDDSQKEIAVELIKELTDSGEYTRPITTQVVELEKFYAAEVYHQDYYDLNPDYPYCQYIISPKISKFQEVFGSKAKPS